MGWSLEVTVVDRDLTVTQVNNCKHLERKVGLDKRILVQGPLQNRFGPGVFHPSSMGMPAPPSSACPASTSLTLPLSSSLQPSNIRAEVVDVGWGFMPVSRE